jgi:hypothetical protein
MTSEGTCYDLPNWATQQEEVHCPLCDYNLRGLSEPRCPECGYRFAWRELLDPALRQLHPYLFEVGRDRVVRFWKTLSAGMRPATFWRSIHPALNVSVGRLLVYWMLVSLPYVVAAVICALRCYYVARLPFWSTYWGRIGALGYVAVYAYPAVLMLTLLIFQASMWKARIRQRHILRCIVYSCDVLLPLGLLLLVNELLGALAPRFAWQYVAVFSPIRVVLSLPLLALGLWIGVSTWRIARAYRYYPRFDHPFATVALSQVIVILLYVIAVVRGNL